MKQVKKKRSTKILAHSHTGKLRHHRHTSYGALALIIMLSIVPIFSASRAVASADAASESVYAVVPGPVPKTAPTISTPASGRTFTTSDPLTIAGTCPADTLVKVFKNEVLAGATLCQNGSYQLKIDLFVGNNSLIARAYNTNDVTSPDSAVVSVQLTPSGSNFDGSAQLNTLGAPAGQFYITSEIFHKGANTGETMTWPLTLFGGQPPYAVSVSWGDGHTELFSRGDTNQFDISHVYSDPAGSKGGYTIVVNATDQAGAKSYLQLVAIVSGKSLNTGVIGTVTGGSSHSGVIKIAWQTITVAIIVVFSFWLGEKRQAGAFGLRFHFGGRA